MSDNNDENDENAAEKRASTSLEASTKNVADTQSLTVETQLQDNGTTRKHHKNAMTPLVIQQKLGCVFDEFKCQHNNFTGILYVGPLGLVFLGRFLLFEWTVVVQWEDVTKVHKRIGEDTCIRVETRPSKTTPEGGIYDFDGFFDVSKALEVVLSLHNGSILDQTNNDRHPSIYNPTRQSSFTPRFLRRSNSDPASIISTLFNFDDDPSYRPVTPQQEHQTNMKDLQNHYEASVAQEDPSDKKQKMHCTLSEVKLQEEWEEKSTNLQEYPHCGLEEMVLEGCDLKAFVDNFLTSTSSASITRFMMDVVGDKDVEASDWEPTEDTKVFSRTIEYTHPVNAPMAPPEARARKEQIWRDYGPTRGLVVETKTIVSDVPMTDCFYVRDILRVAVGSNQTLELTIRFDVVFVKSTMFRALITRTTIGEFQSFMGKLGEYCSKHCGRGMLPNAFESSVPSQTNSIDPPQKPDLLSFAGTSISSSLLDSWSRCFGLILVAWIIGILNGIHQETKSLRLEFQEWKRSQEALPKAFSLQENEEL